MVIASVVDNPHFSKRLSASFFNEGLIRALTVLVLALRIILFSFVVNKVFILV